MPNQRNAAGASTLTITEPPRELPVAGDFDVFVAGAGPAGVVAAMTAARNGARVQMVDVNGCLGGVWTAGLLCWVIGADRKGGLIEEIARRLDQRGARAYRVVGGTNWAYDPEQMKILLEEMCAAEGVAVQLHTRVAAARVENGRLTHAITESKSGRQAFAARLFIDCSGDGDLAQLAGCGFDVGNPDGGGVQPMSFPALLTGVRFHEIETYVGGGMTAPKRRLGELLRSLGVTPSYPDPMLVRIHDDFFGLICDHQFGVPADDAQAITQATLNGRREVHQAVEALRNSGGAWKELRLVATCEHIGVREGRRIHGRGSISVQDLIEGNVPEDSIALCTAPFDVHSTSASPATTEHGRYVKQNARPYGLPLRSLIARDIDGLMMAGRCISGDFLAHSSYRVTGDAAATGQAAGACAALAARSGTLPQNVPFPNLRAALKGDIPH